jgi:hypothetical protein
MSFVIICAIFLLMDFEPGLTPMELKVVTIVWLMSMIHCGSVGVYPIETLIILTITISPLFAKFVSNFSETTLS